MSIPERHLLAYGLLALMIVAIIYGARRWRRAEYERRRPRPFGRP